MILNLDFAHLWGATLDLTEAEIQQWTDLGIRGLSDENYVSLRAQSAAAVEVYEGEKRAKILEVIAAWDALRAKGTA